MIVRLFYKTNDLVFFSIKSGSTWNKDETECKIIKAVVNMVCRMQNVKAWLFFVVFEVSVNPGFLMKVITMNIDIKIELVKDGATG